MISKTFRQTLIFFTLTLLCTSMMYKGAGSAFSMKTVPAVGAVSYSGGTHIYVEPETILVANNLSLAFQLDGPDIRIWRDDGELQDLASHANFKLVRFFEHRMGKPCTSWDESTRSGRWDWTAIDRLVQRIYEIGAEPLIVLGFYSWTLERLSSTPSGMSNNPSTGLPYPDQWSAYCAEWVGHFESVGLPVRYYEIVNEPHHYFGWGTYADETKIGYYMELYNAAARSMRSVNPNIKLSNDNSLMTKVFDHFVTDGEDLDYLSFHRYGLDSRSQSDAEAIRAAETKYLDDSSNFYSIETAKQIYRRERGLDLPAILSEGNLCDDYDPIDWRTHSMLGAVYTALSIKTFILRNLSYCVHFIFGGGEDAMGMINTDNETPWYPYYVHEMFGQNLDVGDPIIKVTGDSDEIATIAWTHRREVYLLIICKSEEPATVHLNGLHGEMGFMKIDDTISWETPRLQSGTIDSADPLMMQGYTVMLLHPPE